MSRVFIWGVQLWLCTMWWSLGGDCGCWGYLGVENVDVWSKPRSGCLQGQRSCSETRSSITSGEMTHILLKLGVLSHKMELWLCAFQRQLFVAGNAGCPCRVVYLCHHTFHPCKERSGAHQALWAQGAAVSTHDSSTCTTLQAAQLERTSLNLCTDKALFTLPNALRSLLFSGKWDRKEAEETTHPSATRGTSVALEHPGTEQPSQADILPTGKTVILDRNPKSTSLGGGFSLQLCLPHAQPVAVGCANNSSPWHTGCWSSRQQKASDSSCGLLHIFICIYFSWSM